MKDMVKSWINKGMIFAGKKAPSADEVISLFTDTVDLLDNIADIAEGTAREIDKQLEKLNAEKGGVLAEADKAKKYSKNIRKVLEG